MRKNAAKEHTSDVMEYSNAHIAFLKKHETTPRKELATLFNTEFGTNQTDKAIKSKCKTLGLKCGRDGRFQKGCVSLNKGIKGLKGANKTSFKRGNTPHNAKKVGSIVKHVDRNNYTYLRIKIAEPNKWQMLHAYIWEHKHGKIPKGHCVIFKDKNTFNLCLDNLMLVSRNELARLNQKYSTIDNSLREVALQVIKIQSEVIKKHRTLQ